jgi:hypothetical protein
MPTLDSALDRYFHHYHAPREVSPRT